MADRRQDYIVEVLRDLEVSRVEAHLEGVASAGAPTAANRASIGSPNARTSAFQCVELRADRGDKTHVVSDRFRDQTCQTLAIQGS